VDFLLLFFMLSGRGLCDELITFSFFFFWFTRNLVKSVALTDWDNHVTNIIR